MMYTSLARQSDCAGFFIPRHGETTYFHGKEPYLILVYAGDTRAQSRQDNRNRVRLFAL